MRDLAIILVAYWLIRWAWWFPPLWGTVARLWSRLAQRPQ